MTADRMRVSLDFFLLMDPERISNKINGKIVVCKKKFQRWQIQYDRWFQESTKQAANDRKLVT